MQDGPISMSRLTASCRVSCLRRVNQSVVLPDEVKLKKYVKGLAKEAASHCPLRHRERRAYAREQIRGLAALVQSEPGMLGPKLPMVRMPDNDSRIYFSVVCVV